MPRRSGRSQLARRFRRSFHLEIEMLEARRLLSGTTTLRIVDYNIDADLPSEGIVTVPQPAFETVLEGIGAESVEGDAQPIDILALEETESNLQTVVPIVNALNAYYGAGTYAYDTNQALSTGATDGNGPNALIYNTKTVTLLSTEDIGFPDPAGAPRQPVRYEFQPVGGSAADDFYVYNSHYKSGSESDDDNGARRQAEAEEIRADSATLPANSRIIYLGDYNVFYPTDPGYETITAPGPNQPFDPINQPIFYGGPKATLTDASYLLTSRIDFQLDTQNVLSDPSGGLYLVPGSYHVFGNDGSVSNVSDPANTALPGLPNRTDVLNALPDASDHLPLVADYTNTVTPPVGPAIGSLTVSPTSVNAGATVVLSANNVVEYGPGSIESVAFYQESNPIAGEQVGLDTLVGMGVQNGSTWTLSTSTSGFGGGIYTYYALATDSAGIVSDPVTTTLSVTGPATPTIGSLTVSPTSVAAGTPVTLDAGDVTILGGTIRNVEFYRETNGTPGLQAGSDLELGNGTQGGSDWLFSTSTLGLPVGTQYYYAVATDNSGALSATATVALTVTAPQPPTIGSFTVSPTSVASGTSVTLDAGNVSAYGATVAGVAFYLETVPGFQSESDTEVGVGTQSGSDWTLTVPTTGLAPGTYTYYAVPTDSNDLSGAPVTASLTVTPPPPPLVNIQILASASPSGPFTSSLVVSPSETLYYEVVGQLAPIGTTNGSYTITSLTAADGINSLSFNLLDPATDTLPISFVTSTLATPSTNPPAASSWDNFTSNPGTPTSVGGASLNELSDVRPAHAPSVYTGALAPDVILLGSVQVASSLPPGASSQITGSFGGTNGLIKINNGAAVIITSTTESSDSPIVGFAPLTLTVASLPSWLSPSSAATWNAGTQTLTVTGAATIIADPGADSPQIVANGSAAVLTIQPATVGFVNLGGITLTNGASIIVPSLGAARTHTNHNVIVLDSNGTTVPTFSIASSSKLDLQDNDLIIQNGGSELTTILADANTGSNGGTWTGNGLTSSVAASVDAPSGVGYEQNLLAVALNGNLPNGPFSSWKAGGSTLALGVNDVIVKYTYNGDFTLEGEVGADAYTIFVTYWGVAPLTPDTFIYGDTTGDATIDANDYANFTVFYGLGTGGANGAQL
jgi:endonuclease/exonuclease/phosphatase family metal-dependent hydrolase